MSYQKQNFANGEVLSASQLNHIEQGIVDVESAANETKAVVDEIIDPTLSLSGKAADAAKVGEAVGQVKEDIKSTKDLTLVETENLWSTSNVIKNAELNSSGEIFFPSGTLWSVYDAFIPVKEDDGEAYLVRGFTNYDSANIDTVDNENLGLVMDVFWAYYDESYKFIAKKRQTPTNRLTIFTVPGSGVWYKAKADGISTRPASTKYIKIQFKTAALNYPKNMPKTLSTKAKISLRLNIPMALQL